MKVESTQSRPRSRRALLTGALGGLGAWLAAAATHLDPADAAVGDPIRMGRLNKTSGSSTTLQTTTSGSTFEVRNHIDDGGTAIFATNTGEFGAAVRGHGVHGIGVAGQGQTVGVRGNGGIGVLGFSPQRSGVWGQTDVGFAIRGTPRERSGFAGYFEGKVFTDRFIEFAEIGNPAAPAANHARLFVRDDGSGKTQVCVRFPTGAVQVLATEP